MKSNQVVTSFLEYENKILIVKRSEKVGTHKNKWSGISGYLEKREKPIERALKEVAEETGVIKKQLILKNNSIPLGIPDPEINDTLWIIYPFLFRVTTRDVKIDWENNEYKWIEPEELREYDTVPLLNEVLRKVLDQPIKRITSNQRIIEQISYIEKDNSHGSAWLARESLNILIRASEAYTSEDLYDYLDNLKILSMKLMFARPSMASIHNQIGKLMNNIIIYSRINKNIAKIKNKFKNEADFIKNESTINIRKIADNVQKITPDKAIIFTHSYSNTIIESIKMLKNKGKNISVYVAEGRPLFEGRKTAHELSKYGIPVTVITDAASGIFAGQASMVLIGADSLLADGSLINKVGTYPIAMAATYQGVPVYIAADLNKINLRSYFSRIQLEEKDPYQVWSKYPKNISIRNIYFDITPKFFINKIITENQRIRPDNILSICEDFIKERYMI